MSSLNTPKIGERERGLVRVVFRMLSGCYFIIHLKVIGEVVPFCEIGDLKALPVSVSRTDKFLLGDKHHLRCVHWFFQASHSFVEAILRATNSHEITADAYFPKIRLKHAILKNVLGITLQKTSNQSKED